MSERTPLEQTAEQIAEDNAYKDAKFILSTTSEVTIITKEGMIQEIQQKYASGELKDVLQKYDINQDGKLEESEIEQLVDASIHISEG